MKEERGFNYYNGYQKALSDILNFCKDKKEEGYDAAKSYENEDQRVSEYYMNTLDGIEVIEKQIKIMQHEF